MGIAVLLRIMLGTIDSLRLRLGIGSAKLILLARHITGRDYILEIRDLTNAEQCKLIMRLCRMELVQFEEQQGRTMQRMAG